MKAYPCRQYAGALLNTVRLTDQFLGELNPTTNKGKQFQSGVNQIVFSDGVIWDRFRMAMQVANPRNTGDVYGGSGSGDVLWGGKGNDVLTGGLGGDIYIFQRGDGQDVISERGGFSFGPIKAGIDFLSFRGDIRWTDLDFLRTGTSDTLTLRIKGTDDQVTMRDFLKEITFLGYYNVLETVEFGDGTKWSYLKLLQRSYRVALAANDNSAWCGVAFRFGGRVVV